MKLRTKIKQLKKDKKYYKNLSKTLSQNFNDLINQQNKKDGSSEINISAILKKKKSDNNIINNVSLQTNNNNFIFQLPEFSSSESSNNRESLNSVSHSFDINEISISSPIRFSLKSEYKNLNTITFGNYSKNKKLRKLIKNLIKTYFIFNKKTVKNSKIYDNPKCFSSVNSEFMDSLSINDYLTKTLSQPNNKNIKTKKKNKKNKNFRESSYFSENNTKTGIRRSNSEISPKKKVSSIIKISNVKLCYPIHQDENNFQLKDHNKNSLLIKTNKQNEFNNAEFEYEKISDNGNNNDHGQIKKCISEQIVENSLNNNNNFTNEPMFPKNNTKLPVNLKKKIEDNNEISNYKVVNEVKKNNIKDENEKDNFLCYIF